MQNLISKLLRHLVTQMWYCQAILKGKKHHFRLTCYAQKRVCLSSLIAKEQNMPIYSQIQILALLCGWVLWINHTDYKQKNSFKPTFTEKVINGARSMLKSRNAWFRSKLHSIRFNYDYKYITNYK